MAVSEGGSGGGACCSTIEKSRCVAGGKSPLVAAEASSGTSSAVAFLLSKTPASVFTTFVPSVFTTVVSMRLLPICFAISYLAPDDPPGASLVRISKDGASLVVVTSIFAPSAATNWTVIPLLDEVRAFSEPVEVAAKFSCANVSVTLGLSTAIAELSKTIGALPEEVVLGEDTSNVEFGVRPTTRDADFKCNLTPPLPKSVDTR